MTKLKQGVLIVFEGTDGTGKSTQLELLHDYLKTNSYDVVTTREPTDGIFGKKIRELYSSRELYTQEEELKLFMDDRRDHVDRFLFPALAQGKIVLCDRYYLSTAAYQGARGYDPEQILEANSFAPEPDIAFLFQAPLELGQSRIVDSRGDALNDFEKLENLKTVSTIFNSLKREYITPIDASCSIAEIHREILHHLHPLLTQITTIEV